MKIKIAATAALGAAVSLSFAASASAQASGGLTANVPGVCIIGTEAMVGSSSVGKAIEARMKVLTAQVSAELQSESQSIQNEDKAISAAAKTATTAAQKAGLEQRFGALQQRVSAYQQKSQLRQAELRQTTNKALGRVGDAARPLIRSVGNAKNCGIVIEATGVADANPSMDITAAVVAQLNTSLPTITFERERITLPAAGAGQ